MMEGWYHAGRRHKDGRWSNAWCKPPCETLFYEVDGLDAYSSMRWERWWDRPIQEHERRAERIRNAHNDGADDRYKVVPDAGDGQPSITLNDGRIAGDHV